MTEQELPIRDTSEPKAIELRPYQIDAIRRLEAAEAAGKKKIILQALTGLGKCLGKGTPVLLYDGRVKKVEDIVVGDMLMGPDSKPRNVLSLARGREMMYRIVPVKGDPYIVNESHILSLRFTNRGNDDKRAGSLVNISVREYLQKDGGFKHCAKGWRTGVEFPAQTEPLLLEPYFLGAWLGDGTQRLPQITTGDFQIEDYLVDYAERLGIKISHQKQKSSCVGVTLVENPGRVSHSKNRVWEALKYYSVANNKHIPHRYLCGSREERLELLAGLIDTDGSYFGGCYEITQKLERLASDIAFLARSLGFAAYVRKHIKTCCNNGVSGEYFRVNISGDLSVVPVKLERKKAAVRLQKKNHLNHGIKVEPIGVDDYYGFEIDGDRLFLLGDFTVTHNTVISCALVDYAVKNGKKVLFLAHRRDLIFQCANKIRQYGIDCGVILGNQTMNLMESVQVASIQSLHGRGLKRRKILMPEADLVIVDECFPSGTMVDGVPIESINVGDLVRSFNHDEQQIEYRKVSHVFKSVPKSLLTIKLSSGATITCTKEHPIYTANGYKKAIDLCDQDLLLLRHGDNREVLHRVRGEVLAEVVESENASDVFGAMQKENKRQKEKEAVPALQKMWGCCRAIWRQFANGEVEVSILLSRLQEGSFRGNAQEGRGVPSGLQSQVLFGKNDEEQPDEYSGGEGKGFKEAEGNWVEAADTGGQWPEHTVPAKIASGQVVFIGGVRYTDKNGQGEWLPKMLQDGHSLSRSDAWDRSRRRLPQFVGGDGEGQEEREVSEWVRVDSIEVHEQDDSGRFGELCKDGFVYNLEVEGNSNYFANGFLVHNCHRSLSKQYIDLMDHYKDSIILGLTATPCRSDGRGLGHVFEHMEVCMKMDQAVKEGWLVPVRYFAPSIPDLKGIKVTAGDYNQGQLEDRMDQVKLIGDIVENWTRLGDNRQTVIFSSGVKHAMHIAEAFRVAGHNFEYVCGDTPQEERDRINRGLADGSIRGVANAMVWTEGWDNPRVSCAILARPTKHPGAYIQMAGRILRPYPGKSDAKIIDHSGSIYNLGRLDEYSNWELNSDGKMFKEVQEKLKKKGKEITCESCKAVYSGQRMCPECGNIPKDFGKGVEFIDGRLYELGTQPVLPKNPAQAPQWLKQKWYSQIYAYAELRGYKKGWVSHTYRDKFGVWPKGMNDKPEQTGKEVMAHIQKKIMQYKYMQARA